jgi:hypothetical protein
MNPSKSTTTTTLPKKPSKYTKKSKKNQYIFQTDPDRPLPVKCIKKFTSFETKSIGRVEVIQI